MGRKRSNDEDNGINLDSLMDALTNVVAVLILVLLLVQADVTQKVDAFLKDLKPATQEEVDQARKELEELKKQTQTKNEQLEQEPPPPEKIEEKKRELAMMEENLEKNEELLVNVNQLKELEIKVRAERDEAQQQTNLVMEEIARLEAMLDQTPVLTAPPAEEVTIPNSRPIPENADIFYALVFGNRVHLIDPVTLLEKFMEEFEEHKRDFRLERVKQQGADLYIHDQLRIAEHFKSFNFNPMRGQKIELLPNTYGTRMGLRITPDAANGGIPMDAMQQPGSEFERAMNGLASNKRAVIMFWVAPDSFNTYLIARKLADKAGVAAGWEVRGDTSYYLPINDVEVRALEIMPPEMAKPKPPTNDPPKLEPKLD